MEDAPLPTVITPNDRSAQTFEIQQDETQYKLNIEIINQNIILNLNNQKDLMKEYENKFSLEELKRKHKIFLMFNSCQEFVDYLEVLIKNNKMSIKNITNEQIYIELIVEYLYKQNIIEIDLFKKKVNFTLIAQDLYNKFSSLNEKLINLELNYQKIIKENQNIKEENKSIKEENFNMKKEIEILKNENKNANDRINNLENILTEKEYGKSKNKIITKEKSSTIINLDTIYEEMNNIINKKLKEFEVNKYHLSTEMKKDLKEEKKDEFISFKEFSLLEKFENKLTEIFFDQSLKINENIRNELKKISSGMLIKGKNPLEIANDFFVKNINNNINGIDDDIKDNLASKKAIIFVDLEYISLKKIETKKIEQFIKELREKYGITEKDIDNKNLAKEIKKQNYDELGIIKIILKKLKYLN